MGSQPSFVARNLGRILGVAILFISFFIISSDDVANYFRAFMDGSFFGPLAYLALLIVGVVLAPITVLPVVALAASQFGVFWTAVLSIVGWTAGAIIAFLVARYVAKPLLEHLVSLEKIRAFEKRLPPQSEFWGIVLLRMIVPVDFLSYALGILTNVSLKTYTLATLIGVTPFSILFAYAGGALSSGSYLTFAGIVLAGIGLFIIIMRGYARRYGIRR